jgi:hypothetical protein
VAVRFASSSRVKNDLPRYSNFWDGTTIFSPFIATGSYDALATYTVPAGGVSSITFAGIPTGGQYSHLQLRYIAMFSSGTAEFELAFNSDTTAGNYARHFLFGDGSSAGAGAATGSNTRSILYTRNTSSTTPGASVLDILDYASSIKNKTLRALNGQDYNGSGAVALISGLWINTSAINSITLQPTAGNISQYSQFSLYGVRG